MEKHSTKSILKNIIQQIFEKKLKANQKMISEHQMVIKYNVSRSITNNVFKKLIEHDVVYSKPHQGYYVSKNFANLAKPIHFRFDIDDAHFNDSLPSKAFYKYSQKFHNSWGDYFQFDYFFKNKLVVKSEHYFLKGFKFDKNIHDNSIFDQLIFQTKLKSIIRKVNFETDTTFKNKLQIVEYVNIYNDSELVSIQRLVIEHEKYQLVKKEGII